LVQNIASYEPTFLRFQTDHYESGIIQVFYFTKAISGLLGLSIAHFDEESCGVRVKYSWFSQNPFRSIYFAVESMAAEMSCGMLAFGQVYKRQPAVSMLVEKVEAVFVKKATGVIIFTCADGAAFEQAVKDALENKEGSKLLSTSVGKNEAGQVVAEFHFTWTFKAKNL
jgi:hypothetical protein